jgi:hypothetical protein
MAEALSQMQSSEMRQKVIELGAAIRAEPDGVAEAVELIEGKMINNERSNSAR